MPVFLPQLPKCWASNKIYSHSPLLATKAGPQEVFCPRAISQTLSFCLIIRFLRKRIIIALFKLFKFKWNYHSIIPSFYYYYHSLSFHYPKKRKEKKNQKTNGLERWLRWVKNTGCSSKEPTFCSLHGGSYLLITLGPGYLTPFLAFAWIEIQEHKH